jgi:hypothetical protein
VAGRIWCYSVETWKSKGGGDGMRVGRRKVRKKGVPTCPDVIDKFAAEKENGGGRNKRESRGIDERLR